MNWQPIETAPKDGSLIKLWKVPLRYAVDYEIDTGEKLENLVFGSYPHDVDGYWKQSRMDAAIKNHGENANPLYGWNVVSSSYTVTHWMPRLAPPEERHTTNE